MRPGKATLIALVDPQPAVPDGAVARRDVTIGGATPKAAVKAAKVSSTWGPGGGMGGYVVPLSAPETCDDLSPPDGPAGYVQAADGSRASVTLACMTTGGGAGPRMSFDGDDPKAVALDTRIAALETAASVLTPLAGHLKDLEAKLPLVITAANRKVQAALKAFARAQTSADVRAVHAGPFAEARTAVDELASLTVFKRLGFAAPAAAPSLASLATEPPQAYVAEAQAIVAAQQRASLVAVILVGAVLLLAGLQALYVGKTFGSVWDVLAALAWGAGTAAVMTPLTAALEGLASTRVGLSRG